MPDNPTTTPPWSDEDAKKMGFEFEPNGMLTIWDDITEAAPMSSRCFGSLEVRKMHAWLSRKIRECENHGQ